MRLQSLCLVLTIILAGCATAPHSPRPRPLAAEAYDYAPVKPSDEVIELGGNSDSEDTGPVETSMPGTGQFTAEQPGLAEAPRPADIEGEASFNFEAASIPEVVKAILGEFLQQNYVIAPGVAGQVTFATTQPVAAEQAMSILELLLAMNNYAMVWRDGKYVILPATEAVRANSVPRLSLENLEAGFQVRAVPLQYIAAAEVEKLLQPFARAGAVLRADNARSLVLLAGTPGDLRNYVDTIRTFDVDWMAGMSFGLFSLERVEVKDLMPELEAIFADQNSPLAGMIKLMPIDRLNAVLVITPQQRYLKEVERWVQRLDQGGSDAGTRLYVYEVINVKAIDLADRLNEIFTGQAPASRSSSASGEVAPGLTPTEITSSSGRPVTSRNQPVPPINMSPTAGATTSGDGLSLMEGSDVRITAVEENNSLLIRSTASQFEVIRSAIRRLDVEPLQVHIEAKILEVQLTNDLSFGVQWYIENFVAAAPVAGVVPTTGQNTGTPGTGATPVQLTNPLAARRGGTIAGFGGILGPGGTLGYVFDTHDARALVNLLRSQGDAKVLSAPSLVVLNNKEASINVGVQIPVNSNSISTIGSATSATVVQFRDTGTTLTVTPRVNPGGMVYMEITQEVSTPGAASEAVNGNPPVNQKRVQTEVAVQSGKTVLLGGLIQQSESSSNAGLPGLSRLPVIGGLFGSRSRNSNRSELLVLITPRVIRGGSAEMQSLTDEYKSRFEGLDALIREDARAAEAAQIRYRTTRGEQE